MHHHITGDISASLVEARSRVPGVKYKAFTVKQPDMEATEERAPQLSPLSTLHTAVFGIKPQEPPRPLKVSLESSPPPFFLK